MINHKKILQGRVVMLVFSLVLAERGFEVQNHESMYLCSFDVKGTSHLLSV